ncbi:MAG: polyprenol monophosphomannose synthase [Bdellovibrionales bacterium]
MKILVIIPTYNERENIVNLIPAIRQVQAPVEILVVDDNSPDGTAEVVKGMQAQDKGLHLLSRAGKEGLGRAYLAGFDWALTRGYEAVIEMDADFSHRPEDLLKIVAALPDHDFVVGSRWVPGGRTENWGMGRIIISRGGSFYSRMILGYPIRDWTGGFNAWKAKTLRGIELGTVRSNGYSFQIELKYRALRQGFRGQEVPIVFADRRVGQSKMSTKIVLEALHRVWSIRAQS